MATASTQSTLASSQAPATIRRVCMIAYTVYDGDARVRREAEALASTGRYRVRMLSLRDGESRREYVIDGVDVQQLDVTKYRGKNPLKYILSYVVFTLRAFMAVTRLARAKAIDVVHVHNMPNFLVLAALVPKLQGKAVVLDVHDTMPETFSATFSPRYRRGFLPLLGLEERFSYAIADQLIAVNDVQRDAILGRLPGARSRVTVSMNVPDPRLFGEMREFQPTAQHPERFKLVYHGTVSGRLNVGLAIEAVLQCAESIPEIQLHIIGDGDARERLMRECQDRSVGDRVVFHDWQPFHKLIAVIRGMDLGIVPLQRNAATELMLPVKLMECISQGVPVVAPRLGAVMHYFGEDALFYFEPGDLETLIQAIQAARSPDARSSRLATAQAALGRFDWTSHKSNLLNLYDRL